MAFFTTQTVTRVAIALGVIALVYIVVKMSQPRPLLLVTPAPTTAAPKESFDEFEEEGFVNDGAEDYSDEDDDEAFEEDEEAFEEDEQDEQFGEGGEDIQDMPAEMYDPEQPAEIGSNMMLL